MEKHIVIKKKKTDVAKPYPAHTKKLSNESWGEKKASVLDKKLFMALVYYQSQSKVKKKGKKKSWSLSH